MSERQLDTALAYELARVALLVKTIKPGWSLFLGWDLPEIDEVIRG